MTNGIRPGGPVDSIKNVVRSSGKVPEFDKHLKKTGGHIGNDNKDEDNSPKTLNDKNPELICLHTINGFKYWYSTLIIFFNIPHSFHNS